MYEMKEIVLKNGPMERKRLVIEFTGRNKQIIGELLMVDVNVMNQQIVHDLEAVLKGETKEFQFSGNRCYVKGTKDVTYIEDLYEDMEGMESYPAIEIDTKELLEIIYDWLERLKQLS